jgi:RNA polymerase sigma-70 factor (ECF subfamily)
MTALNQQLPGYLLDHREAIRRYIQGLVRDSAEADDLTQEAYLRAQARLPTLRDQDKALPWLYRIATNVSYDRFRQASFKRSSQSQENVVIDSSDPAGAASLPDEGPRLDLAMERDEMSGCVQQYVSGLSDNYRAVILLHDTQGLTNPEIADMLDLSLATVKIRLHRARKRLREALQRACSFSHDDRGVLVCEPKPDDCGC